jgi:hypothetical protein
MTQKVKQHKYLFEIKKRWGIATHTLIHNEKKTQFIPPQTFHLIIYIHQLPIFLIRNYTYFHTFHLP